MSYCDCDWDYDQPSFYRETLIAASRKQYRCDECRGPILKGEQYKQVVGKWEGDLDTFRTCQPCIELKQWAEISVPCFCASIGELHERAREMVDDLWPTIPGFLFEWGRRVVKIRRRKSASPPALNALSAKIEQEHAE